jgi:hypothetical protein
MPVHPTIVAARRICLNGRRRPVRSCPRVALVGGAWRCIIAGGTDRLARRVERMERDLPSIDGR